MKFTEERLEKAIIEHFKKAGYPYVKGDEIERKKDDVLIKADLKEYLQKAYAKENITESEIDSIIRKLEAYPSSDLYGSNKAIMKLISDGFVFKRDLSAESAQAGDRSKKDLFISLIDYSSEDSNIYKIVNQFEIDIYHKRIPDAIIFINGIPLVVFEFKSAIREEATIHSAYEQLTVRYERDIPDLFKYNALCVISDGVNNKMGSFFAPYEYFYAWRSEQDRQAQNQDGINTLYSMIEGLFDKKNLRNVIQNFIYFPDTSKKDEKIVCRYPQFYAANKLFDSIIQHQRPKGDGKGGTYFGATGSGKSFTMLYLTRLLMRSIHFSSPTIIIITDRTDLDDQLAGQFTNSKAFIGDDIIESVESRSDLRAKIQGRNSGGVFLTTIHKFTEDTDLLTKRNNVICISDEAHRSQINLDQKIKITDKGVKRTYGFAKHLHDSLPNATYVGFTGTPIDATLDVFGGIIDTYTMTESVKDEITVRIVYEGRAAKVALDNNKLRDIEDYYASCVAEGSTEYQVEQSKKETTNMESIIGDPDRLNAIANDLVEHYEKRISEGATVKAKAMIVCSNRFIAYELYKKIIDIRPQWAEIKEADDGVELTEKDRKEIKPIERIKMIMTRGQDDPKELYDMLGTKDYRKELDRQFKNAKSNFKIAVVVDMWLTGFDVPFLDTMYIDKAIQKHSLIQTISRVNRKFEGKDKGLVVDYFGIKSQMNKALAMFANMESTNFEDIAQSVVIVKDHLDLLSKMFHKFDSKLYFSGTATEQLETLNKASEFVQQTQKHEKRFMELVKRMKSAYDISCGSEDFTQEQRDTIHFYLAVRTIVYKLTKGDAPDTAQMNAKVREMIAEALKSEGVEEIFKLGDDKQTEIDIFDDDYIEKINKIKLPNTKIKLLQKMLKRAIDEFKKINKTKATDFSKKFQSMVERYNERKDSDILRSEVLDDFANEIVDLYHNLRTEKDSFSDMGITFEEKAFYDILKSLARKYDFNYPEDKLIHLAKQVKNVVDDKAKYTDWDHREDIKAELKVDLIILLAENDYPPVDRDEVYKEIFEQAENFKKYQNRI